MDRAEHSDHNLRTLWRGNLPVALTSFVGRERETAEIAGMLASSRLVTLTGVAGCGKTRLALRVADLSVKHYADGVHWVELARVSEPALVPQSIARAIRVPERPGNSVLDLIVDALRDRRLLLALDNCEHVLSACAEIVERLLAESDVSVLATSREPLGVASERRYPLAPLTIPPESAALADLGTYDAVRLFVERSRAILPGFDLTSDNAVAVGAICRSLDGIPLAIELASARVNVLTAQQIMSRLEDRLNLLSDESPATLSHHRTMRAAIDWSYELLAEPEQILLRRLSVFAGGCSLGVAETVCAGDGVEVHEVLGLMSSLVDKSLVMADTLHRGEARYSLLETIRQYAHERLDAAGEASAVRDGHLAWFLQVAEETSPKLSSEYQHLWLNWLEDEYDNVRSALAWALESGQTEAGLRISIALYEFWAIRNYLEEGLSWLGRLLGHGDESVSALVRARALAYASFLAGIRGNRLAQVEYGLAASALAGSVEVTEPRARFWALSGQAYRARSEGNFHGELSVATQCIRLAREMDDHYLLGLVLSLYSPTAMALGDYDLARGMLREGLTLLEKSGDSYRVAMALNYTGDLARCEQKHTEARAAYERSVSLLREIDAARDLASVLHNLGHTCLRLGDVERANDLISESMAVHRAESNAPGMAECLIGFAALALAYELPGAAARLLAASVAHGEDPTASIWAATRMEYEHALERARAGLTEAEFLAEQSSGRALSLDEAVEYAQDILRGAVAARPTRRRPDDLTARERQVVALIAQARSNDEIAEHLFLSKRTVEKHIANIRSKLEFTQRAQIVRWAIESGLSADTPGPSRHHSS